MCLIASLSIDAAADNDNDADLDADVDVVFVYRLSDEFDLVCFVTILFDRCSDP